MLKERFYELGKSGIIVDLNRVSRVVGGSIGMGYDCAAASVGDRCIDISLLDLDDFVKALRQQRPEFVKLGDRETWMLCDRNLIESVTGTPAHATVKFTDRSEWYFKLPQMDQEALLEAWWDEMGSA